MKQSLLVRFVILSLLVANMVFVSGMNNLVMADPAKTMQTVQLLLPPAAPSKPAWSDAEITCLARTIYGESRNQPFEGQVAVGAVVVSRSLNPKWPKDLCAVVREPKQFAGYWAVGNPPPGTRSKAWDAAFAAAHHATSGYHTLPPSYREVYYFTLRHERSNFHAKLPLQGYIADHAFYRDLGT